MELRQLLLQASKPEGAQTRQYSSFLVHFLEDRVSENFPKEKG